MTPGARTSTTMPAETNQSNEPRSTAREMTRSLHRSHGSFELALAPAILALLGLWLDRTIGTVPLFTLLFAAVGIAGSFAKIYYQYRNSMAELERVRPVGRSRRDRAVPCRRPRPAPSACPRRSRPTDEHRPDAGPHRRPVAGDVGGTRPRQAQPLARTVHRRSARRRSGASRASYSTLYALLIVVANFLLSAYLLAVTGRINAALMAGAAMFGFLLRLGLIFLAVMLVRDAWWVELVPLGLTLIVAHLALLFWEMRYVSGTLAFPGLKPQPTPNPYLPSSDADDARRPRPSRPRRTPRPRRRTRSRRSPSACQASRPSQVISASSPPKRVAAASSSRRSTSSSSGPPPSARTRWYGFNKIGLISLIAMIVPVLFFFFAGRKASRGARQAAEPRRVGDRLRREAGHPARHRQGGHALPADAHRDGLLHLDRQPVRGHPDLAHAGATPAWPTRCCWRSPRGSCSSASA